MRERFKRILKMVGQTTTLAINERLDVMEQRTAEIDNALLRASLRLTEEVRRKGRYQVIPSADRRMFHPVTALMRHLYSMFPEHRAMEIGTGDGEWSAEISMSGYTVVPLGNPSVELSRPAVARVHGAATLGDWRPAVVIADLEAASCDRVEALRALGYRWHIVVESPHEGEAGRFYANYEFTLPGWLGNTVFFRDHVTFVHALNWCEAVLHQVYIGPAETSA